MRNKLRGAGGAGGGHYPFRALGWSAFVVILLSQRRTDVVWQIRPEILGPFVTNDRIDFRLFNYGMRADGV